MCLSISDLLSGLDLLLGNDKLNIVHIVLSVLTTLTIELIETAFVIAKFRILLCSICTTPQNSATLEHIADGCPCEFPV